MNLEKINELIATKVMGWYKYSDPIWEGSFVWVDSEDNWHGFDGFKPAEDIEDAWEVLNHVCGKHNWRAIIDRNQNQTEVNFKDQIGVSLQYYGTAETPEMAIMV